MSRPSTRTVGEPRKRSRWAAPSSAIRRTTTSGAGSTCSTNSRTWVSSASWLGQPSKYNSSIVTLPALVSRVAASEEYIDSDIKLFCYDGPEFGRHDELDRSE